MLAISSDILNEIVQKCKAAAPREACGLLFGADGVISTWTETANVAADPLRHFEIDPAALIAALRAERHRGPRLLGYWHSHPSGDAAPSATDAAMAAPDGKLWLIVGGGAITAWRAVENGAAHGRFAPVEIVVG
ncbi:M67 family metallopeptidase [Sphingomonas sp.]|uniref:M67 family metallopeptidase n=1 Tax=Sphingomonas sp. TaxID=28214 RepID=UPI0031D028F5